MFTGLIEEVGYIQNIASYGEGKKIRVKCKNILPGTKIDDSIAVNGICQTVTDINDCSIEFISVEETLRKTTIKYWHNNQKVNLERALRLSDRLGGHLLLGHIDGIGKILTIGDLSSSVFFEISIPRDYSKYIVPQGSIAINGISLTVADFNKSSVYLSIIPHTIAKTTLGFLSAGEYVNLEFDLIGKYIEKLARNTGRKESGLTLERLSELGY